MDPGTGTPNGRRRREFRFVTNGLGPVPSGDGGVARLTMFLPLMRTSLKAFLPDGSSCDLSSCEPKVSLRDHVSPPIEVAQLEVDENQVEEGVRRIVSGVE